MSELLTYEEVLARHGHLAYTNKGVSMLPLLRQGKDVMLIDRKSPGPCRRLDAVLFRRPLPSGSVQYVMHRILRINSDGTYWIVGDNCVTGDTVKEEQILGILTGVVRNGRTILVTDWKYRIYVNTWCRFFRIRIAILRAGRLFGRFLRKLGRCR